MLDGGQGGEDRAALAGAGDRDVTAVVALEQPVALDPDPQLGVRTGHELAAGGRPDERGELAGQRPLEWLPASVGEHDPRLVERRTEIDRRGGQGQLPGK